MKSYSRRPRCSQNGQTLVLFAVSMIGLLAFAAFGIDFGFTLHAYNELQASTNAAATAGALALTDSGVSTSTSPGTNNLALQAACGFSSVTSSQPACPSGTTLPGKNADGDLPNVSMVSGYPEVRCLATLSNLACINGGTANAVEVVQQVSVPTFFARVLGLNSITLRASALAAMKGGTSAPGNIVVIMDTTRSMSDADSDPNCKAGTGIASPTRLDCAKWGVRTFLMELSPCAQGLSSCGSVTNGNVPNPVSQITLLTFPGLASSSDAPYDYLNCQATSITPYIAPYAGPPTTQPPYFTIVPPSSDYRTSDSSGLNGGASDLVKAVDWADGAGCTNTAYGLQGPGGVSTYYAGVITEAESDITALTAPRASMQSAIILLSDGDAEATCTANASGYCTSGGDFTTTTKAIPYAQNECHQAISAAATAAAWQNPAGLGIWFYAIAFGSSTSSSSSCKTDSPPTGTEPISGCSTMTEIASDPTKFYSDDANGCLSADHPSITSLNSIFENIAGDFQTTRLLPPGTT
jgi:hypothetical protein